MFGFLGPNGAGKSTTIRLLLDLIRPSSGRITLFGESPRGAPALRARVGYVPGDLVLYDRLTGRDHLHYFAALRGMTTLGDGEALARTFELELDRPAKDLSRGNRQKVSLVLAFMHRPDLLVLDEPTSGLDPIVQQAFHELVRRTADEGRTIFLSSHVLPEVQRVADRVGVIRDGRLQLVESVETLRGRAFTRVEATFAPPLPAVGEFDGLTGCVSSSAAGTRSCSRCTATSTTSSRRSPGDTSSRSTATKRTSRTSSSTCIATETPVPVDVFAKTLRDLRRAFAWWSVGLVGLVAMMIAVYPTVRGDPALDKLVENYPDALKQLFGFGGELDYSSPAGYLGMELFSFMVPLLLIVAAIAAGSNAIAGEEERGTLDLLLSTPTSRRRVVLEKFGALLAEACGLGLVLWASLVVGAHAVGMDIGAWRLGAATLGAVLLAVAFGAVALLVGSASGRRGRAIGLAAAAAVLAYLVNSLAPLVSSLDTARRASPFYYYSAGNPLRHGLDPVHASVLLAVALASVAAACVALERRDLGT